MLLGKIQMYRYSQGMAREVSQKCHQIHPEHCSYIKLVQVVFLVPSPGLVGIYNFIAFEELVNFFAKYHDERH